MKKLVERQRVNRYLGVITVFRALLSEVKELAKKKPEATLSKTKVTHINRVLADSKCVVENEPEAKYCDLLETEALPQYSDAILIMAQFDGALKAFYSRHYGNLPHDQYKSGWYYDDEYSPDDVGDEENEDDDEVDDKDEE